MTDFNWRPHRFVQQQFTPDDTLELLWPANTVGMIDTICLLLVSEESADIAVLVNTSVIAAAQLLTAGGGPLFEVPVFLTNLNIPLWEGDLLEATFGAAGPTSNGSLGIYGRVGAWVGPIVPVPFT